MGWPCNDIGGDFECQLGRDSPIASELASWTPSAFSEDTSPVPTPEGYLREYPGSGPPLVLVGEILGGGASWSAHAERLSPLWRVSTVTPLAVVHAARGELPPLSWGIPTERQALADALLEMGVWEAHLAGWSMGGAIALDFALTFPELVRTLTLVEPQVRWLLRALGRETALEREETEWFRNLVDGPITEQRLGEFLLRVGAVAPGEEPQQSRAWRLAWANRLALRSAWGVAAHEDTPDRLQSLDMPLLLVRGDSTDTLDRAMVDGLAELLPAARRLVLPGAHTSHMTAIDRFLETFEAFLQQTA